MLICMKRDKKDTSQSPRALYKFITLLKTRESYIYIYNHMTRYRFVKELQRIIISTCNSNSFSRSCRDFFSASILHLSSSISAVVSVILSGTFPFWNQIDSTVTDAYSARFRRRRFYTSFASLTSIPSSFFSCLFSSWRDKMLFLAIARSSFIRAFVVVKDSTFAWRFVTVALKSTGNVKISEMHLIMQLLTSEIRWTEWIFTSNVDSAPRCNSSDRVPWSYYRSPARHPAIRQVCGYYCADRAKNRSRPADSQDLPPITTCNDWSYHNELGSGATETWSRACMRDKL